MATVYYKFAIPAMAFGGMCVFTFVRAAPVYGAVAFAGAFVLTTWFSISLKKVALFEKSIRVSSYFSQVDIPRSHLIQIVEHRWQRPQFVTLTFSPATKWGGTIRMLTPLENLRYAVEALESIVDHNIGPNQSTDPAP